MPPCLFDNLKRYSLTPLTGDSKSIRAVVDEEKGRSRSVFFRLDKDDDWSKTALPEGSHMFLPAENHPSLDYSRASISPRKG